MLGERAGLAHRFVDAGAVTELEEVLDHPEMRGEQSLGRDRSRREGQHLASVGNACLGARRSHQRDPARLERDRDAVGVVRAPRLVQAALRERVPFFLRVGQHERERELAQHRDEEADVGVCIRAARLGFQAGQGVAEQRRALASSRSTATPRPPPPTSASVALRRRDAAALCSRELERGLDALPSLGGVTQRALGASEADERPAAVVDVGGELGGSREVVARHRPRRLRERGLPGFEQAVRGVRVPRRRRRRDSGGRAPTRRHPGSRACRRAAGAAVGAASRRSSRAPRHARVRAGR